MYSVGVYLACVAVATVLLTVPAHAGHSQSLAERTAHLALNLVDMRCPSQFERLFASEKGTLLGNFGRRHLLNEEVPEAEEFVFDGAHVGGSRHLLAGMSLKAFRESARAAAVARAHEFCTGAPDDRGPAVFFPLHLDIDVDNTPAKPGAAEAVMPVAVGAVPAKSALSSQLDAMGGAVTDADTAAEGEEAPAEGPAGEESGEGGGDEEGGEEEKKGKKKSKKDKKKDKKKNSEEDGDEDAAQVVDGGPSVIMVMVLLMLVGSGIGIAGYKFLNAKVSNEQPLSERASNIKKQLTRMQNALENS
mmetsp:Transcript_20250/g.33954  ORF Transcript_20250/g.33954 Transcript_20250/m.33954 type:complete len:304 (+) Transcript_20250:161-1072(+)|eukprot:CAMPEP_0198198754 /NCGR_PEP_ID=MMETSP1445-20131203/2156_1 /TAXON_ID=36898 /ORGANISM="Pyramimonas sp., Strain CCMP2087" /LENGTH=303 /DNA_ID=CAMNT_0043868391 /DNA_START=153 /DNA_END=1064 /DNA_ORIENTATION=+